MMIDADAALVALDDAVAWRLRPALDAEKLFDDIASKLHQRPEFKGLTINQLDLLLADLRREFAHAMRGAEWQLYDAFRCSIGDF
jgi:hypothetical protein